jgi:hypothetical protein
LFGIVYITDREPTAMAARRSPEQRDVACSIGTGWV